MRPHGKGGILRVMSPLALDSTPIPGFTRVLWSVWLCFELDSRGTPLPLGFWRVRYCVVVGEECFLCDCGWFLSVFDVGADVRCRRNSKHRGLLGSKCNCERCVHLFVSVVVWSQGGCEFMIRIGDVVVWRACERAKSRVYDVKHSLSLTMKKLLFFRLGESLFSFEFDLFAKMMHLGF